MNYLPPNVIATLQAGDLLLVHADPRLGPKQIDEVRAELAALPTGVFGMVYPESPDVRDRHSVTRITRPEDIALLGRVAADHPPMVRFIHVSVGPPVPAPGVKTHPTA